MKIQIIKEDGKWDVYVDGELVLEEVSLTEARKEAERHAKAAK